MQLPVEFSVSGGVSNNLLVKVLDSCFSCSVGVNSGVDVGDKGVEVVLVLLGDLVVFGLIVSEPRDNFVLVEVKGESMVLDVDPFRRVAGGDSHSLHGVGGVFSESEGVESEHGDNVGGSGVELVSQEGLDLRHDSVDMCTMEVGVVHHVSDDLSVSADVDLPSGRDERAEHDPVVLIKGSDLELEVLEGPLPVAHEQVVFRFESDSPLVDAQPIKNQNKVVVHTVGSASLASTDINMLSCDGCRYNVILLDDLLP